MKDSVWTSAAAIAHAISNRYGGTIDKFIGDAILVFFGDPETEGDRNDALKCAHMALRMRDRVRELEKIWHENGISKPLKVRMGINTGYCTVGNFGSEHRLEYTVLGSPVNLASRLQTAAEADTILIRQVHIHAARRRGGLRAHG